MDRTADDHLNNQSHYPRHIDTVVGQSTQTVNESREVEINRSSDWGPIGVALFLSSEELENLGVDPEATDRIVIRVQDGFVLIDPK